MCLSSMHHLSNLEKYIDSKKSNFHYIMNEIVKKLENNLSSVGRTGSMLKELKVNFVDTFCNELEELKLDIFKFDGDKVKIYCGHEIKKLSNVFNGYSNWLLEELLKKYTGVLKKHRAKSTDELVSQLRVEMEIKKQSRCLETNMHIDNLKKNSFLNNCIVKLISPTVPIGFGVIIAYLVQHFFP